MTAAPVLGPDDPRADDVRALLARHLAFGHQRSPPEDVHTLDVGGLLGPEITFRSARVDGTLVAVGALRDLGDGHLELKSMHTASEHRGQGHGRRMLLHLLALARERGATRVSLETGSMDAFAPARTLYAAAGFVPCEPFGDYSPSRNSSFFTLVL
ncbi:GNAT family N-acetyltransferase [Nocardioides sp. dk4132]|uniref:GNAT family N-acetyltransferase n=1 Tax=unclassified Nocardioides TaxID=2615069 RepID=UPI0012966E4A|nr:MULTISPECIES: GNAT family N-acetyltransferase [unclassified Nocardioides]MQW77402.1 GNAT family N-acetyltransferase [Nocardioides sp. dk4132]QGA09213.1 GNAT family N-acetyltransferase [Nocardioides sp. dk884]